MKKYWVIGGIIIIILIVGIYRQPKKLDINNKITIGAVLPLTGPIALSGGEQCRVGALIAVEDINKEGGIDGRQLELKIEDSKSNNTDGTSAFNSILNFNNPIAMVSLGSALSKTLSPIAAQNKIPLLTTITSDPTLTLANDFTFRYYPTAEQEVPPIVQIAKSKNLKKFAVLYLDDDFGQAMLKTLKSNFDGEIVSDSFVISDADFKTQLTKLKSANPDALLIVGFANHMVIAAKQAKELGLQATLFTSSSGAIPGVREGLKNLGITIFVPAAYMYGEKSSEVLALRKKFEETKNNRVEFDHYVVDCYDVVNLLSSTLKNNVATKEELKDRLLHLKKFVGLSGQTIIAGKEFNFPLFPAKVQGGNVEFLDL